MKLNEQREWYEGWHDADRAVLPVEDMKQRTRLAVIDRALKHVQPQSVLVVGCGRGDELRLIQVETLTAFDLSVSAVRQANSLLPRNHYLQADGMQLPFVNGSFDFVLSSEVIEHMLNPEQMLAEINRVLKPGGHVLLTTPNWTSFFGMARWMGEKILRRSVTSDDQPVDHWYTQRMMKAVLQQAGFNVVKRYGAWYFPPTGLGTKRLPDRPMASLFSLLLPVEKQFQSALPDYGHLLVVLAQSR
jgi:ubiquinone/menaquinone biosynthesis C-methylase UbiE